jgi:hypothetical protein
VFQAALAGSAFSSKAPYASALISGISVPRISGKSLAVRALCATGSCMLSCVSHGKIAVRSASRSGCRGESCASST